MGRSGFQARPSRADPTRLMFRRLLGGVLLTVGLLAASVAWTGFTLQRTAFDAGRSERLASVLLGSAEVQQVLVDRTANALADALPAAAASEVPRADLERAARSALASPEASAAVRAALADTHRYLIGDRAEAPGFDTAPLDAALRARLTEVQPDLAEVVPQLPALSVELPTAGLSAARALRSLVDRVTQLAAVAAVVAIGGALVVAPDRGRVLRRVGWWAIVTGGLWVALRFALPVLARALIPGGAALVSALVEAVAERMAVPGMVLAAVGAVTLCMGLAVGGSGAARWSARRLGQPPPAPTGRLSPPRSSPARSSPARSAPGRSSPGRPSPHPEPTGRLPAVDQWVGGASRSPGDPTIPLAVLPQADQRDRDADDSPAADGDRSKVSGADPVEAPPADAGRWVEGVGYVGAAEAEQPSRRPTDRT